MFRVTKPTVKKGGDSISNKEHSIVLTNGFYLPLQNIVILLNLLIKQ